MIMNTTKQMVKNYKLTYANIVWCLFACLLTGCASMRPPVISTFNDSINNYRYFCILPTDKYESEAQIYGNQYGVWGNSGTSLNPASIISGILIKNGFVQVNDVNSANASQTMIVNFGESGRRNVNLGYSIEVTIQFISAQTQQPICICTAEGQGITETDDVREAIQRALKPLFEK